MAGSSTLNGGITSTADTLVVADASTFPSSGFVVTIDDERIHVYRVSGTSFVGLNRAWDGTTKASHSDGAAVTELATHAEMAVREGELLVPYDTRVPHPEHRRRKLR